MANMTTTAAPTPGLLGPGQQIVTETSSKTGSTSTRGPSSTSRKARQEDLDEIAKAERALADAQQAQADADLEASGAALGAQPASPPAGPDDPMAPSGSWASPAEQAAAAEAERTRAMDEEIKKRVAESDARVEEAARARNFKDYWEEKSMPARLLAGLLVGAGAAVGSTAPREIYDTYAKRDTELKLARASMAEKEALRAGKTVEEARQAKREAQKTALESAEARDKAYNLHLEKVAKYGPEKMRAEAAKRQVEAAQKDLDAKRDKLKFFAETVQGEQVTTTKGGTKSSSVTTGKDAGAAAGASKKEDAEAMYKMEMSALEKAEAELQKWSGDYSDIPQLQSRMKPHVDEFTLAQTKLTGARTQDDTALNMESMVPGVGGAVMSDLTGAGAKEAALSRIAAMKAAARDRRNAILGTPAAAPPTTPPAPAASPALREKLAAGDKGGDINLDEGKKAAPARSTKDLAEELTAYTKEIGDLRRKKDRTAEDEADLKELEAAKAETIKEMASRKKAPAKKGGN
jgi:hypothetical protein